MKQELEIVKANIDAADRLFAALVNRRRTKIVRTLGARHVLVFEMKQPAKRFELRGDQTFAEFDQLLRRQVISKLRGEHYGEMSGFYLPNPRGWYEVFLGTIRPYGTEEEPVGSIPFSGGDCAGDGEAVKIGSVHWKVGDRVRHRYDYYDNSDHTLTLVAVQRAPHKPAIKVPRRARHLLNEIPLADREDVLQCAKRLAKHADRKM